MLATHENDKKLEDTLKRLSDRWDFTIPNAYKIFNPAETCVNSTDIKETCDLYGVNYDDESVFLVVERYDSDSDGKLNFMEFRDMISPKSATARRLLQVRPHYDLSGDR